MKRVITYEEYEKLMDKLVNKLLDDKAYKKFNYLYPIPRGGFPIAIHLSHYLDIPIIYSVISSEVDKTLLVDDLIDSGETFSIYRSNYKYNHIATLFYKPLRDEHNIKPTYYIEDTDDWVVFPWEKLDEVPNREGYEDINERRFKCRIMDYQHCME